MEKLYIKFKWMRSFSALVVMMLFAITANATSTYYYKAVANASPTAAGKVYVSTSQTNSPSYQNGSYTTNGSRRNIFDPSVTFYFYASANDGYIFDHWAETANGASVSTSSTYSFTGTVTSTRSGSPTTFTRYAVFKEQTGLVKVYSEDDHKGMVSINNIDNKLGDNVVLTATPDASNGVKFLGWKKGSLSASEYISEDNPYSFEVTTETEGNYYACFSEPQQTVYCRIQNKATGKFLSVYGNASANPHTQRINGRTIQDGYIFTNGLKMISASEAQGNPATVFKRVGTPSGLGHTSDVDFTAHGVSYQLNLTDTQHPIVIDDFDDYVSISTIMDLGDGVTSFSYLVDEGTDWAVMKSYSSDAEYDDATEWVIYLLDEDEVNGQFGANTKAKFTQDGKYYTTMYTDFAYQLLDGVKAYYLAADETSYQEGSNTVVLTEITSGIVPENTAVILECTDVQNDASAAEVKNRLLPLKDPVNEPLHNILKGYISLNGSKVANNHDKMYVFSMNGENKLGFYHSTSANMTPNKAYLDVSDVQESIDDNPAIKNVRISFGDPDNEETTIITLTQLDEANTSAIYDLSGRKVSDDASQMNDLRKGIYIANGKKYIVK